MRKLAADPRTAVAERVRDGMTIAVGGFGLCGIPRDLIEAVRDSGVRDLTIVSNNMGVDGKGLGVLLENSQVRKVIASYVGENKLFAQQYLDGALEVEFCPQGTLAERLRAYTRTGVCTEVAEGKPHETFDGETFVLERGIVADLALVHANTADAEGNLRYRATARNFNPLVAMSGQVCIAEAETVLDGFLDPDEVMTPGIFVDVTVLASDRPKDIEQRIVRPRIDAAADAGVGA
jgi:3-oxoacid CoA-transferase subunit A